MYCRSNVVASILELNVDKARGHSKENNTRFKILGTCGCGKTNLLLNLLLKIDILDYNKIIVYGKSFFNLSIK